MSRTWYSGKTTVWGYQRVDGAARLRSFAAPSAKIDESINPKSRYHIARVSFSFLSVVVLLPALVFVIPAQAGIPVPLHGFLMSRK